jgi:hypothetical protein
MIMWRGWGILILLVALVWFIALFLAFPGHGEMGEKTIGRIGSLALLLSAGSVWLMTRYRSKRPRIVVDPASGSSVAVPRCDDLWYIPMRFWAPILAVGAVGLFIYSLF